MKIKICGMRQPDNIEAVRFYEPDYMGFIFYNKSSRFVKDEFKPSKIHFNGAPYTVGVFVNRPLSEVIRIVTKYHLDFVQLHGDESVEYVKGLREQEMKIIKAFQINDKFDWTSLKEYTEYVRYFLFDNATKNYGGSGLKFNWQYLESYKEDKPFFLSGGISIDDIQEIKKLTIPQLYGIDVNSQFEIEPGLKNVELVKEMINKVRDESKLSS